MPDEIEDAFDDEPLDEREERILAHKYGLDDEALRILKALKKGTPLKKVKGFVTEDLWVREVLKLLQDKSPMARIRALELMAKYLGIGAKSPDKYVKVAFEQTPAVDRQEVPDDGRDVQRPDAGADDGRTLQGSTKATAS